MSNSEIFNKLFRPDGDFVKPRYLYETPWWDASFPRVEADQAGISNSLEIVLDFLGVASQMFRKLGVDLPEPSDIRGSYLGLTSEAVLKDLAVSLNLRRVGSLPEQRRMACHLILSAKWGGAKSEITISMNAFPVATCWSLLVMSREDGSTETFYPTDLCIVRLAHGIETLSSSGGFSLSRPPL